MTSELTAPGPGIAQTRRSPSVAAFLSFLWPGLGQWYAGRSREAAIFAIPVAVITVIGIIWLAGGLDRVVLDLLVPGVAILFILLVIADGALRLTALLHAATLPDGRAEVRRPPTIVVIVILGLIVLISHVWAVAVGWSLYEAAGRVFSPPIVVAPIPTPSATPRPSTSLLPSNSPTVTPEPKTPRINILLTGIDSGARRNHALTDTLIVVSIDPDTGEIAMVSFPRDIADFTMSDGRKFRGKINALMTEANKDPAKYPGGGMPTLMRELGFLLGVPIDYYASVDLNGFASLIDAVGGVTIDNPKAINDPSYGGWTDRRVGFRLSAGEHRLDGENALAYARSRRGFGDNDFTRARRQQQLLVALRNKLTDPSILPQLPSIIDAGSRTLKTNFPQDRLQEMLTLSKTLEVDDEIRRVVLGPPYAKNPPPGTSSTYKLVFDMDRLAKLSVDLFGADSSYATPTH